MKRFEIGPGVTCDLDRLVDTRLLVQANSGGGKSWLLRRLLEQTHGQVQHLVIDPEGEFASLRERFDYVLAAKSGGDTAADPRSATLLAERLLELKVSAILDIYELKPHERIVFVRRFLEALVDAPKALWHPALVVVDEAHVYCPQAGEAESAGAVKDLATRGRKRGFAALLATQRLSKLHKDAAAECNNKLIGRTALDVDMKRAADELGFTGRDDSARLRALAAGEFYAFGPAFNFPGIARVQVGPVETTHPKAGARLAFTAPPATAKVKALLPKLADLPAEAEERVKSVETLKREVAELRRDLHRAKDAAPAPEVKTVETFALKDGQLARAEKLVAQIDTVITRYSERVQKAIAEFEAKLDDPLSALRLIEHEIADALAKTRAPQSRQPHEEAGGRRAVPSPTATRPAPAPRVTASQGSGDGSLTRAAERKILTVLAQYPEGRSVRQVAILAVYAKSGGGFRNALGRLRSLGYLEGTQDKLTITPAGYAALGAWDPLPTGRALGDYWLRQLQRKAEREVLQVLITAYPDGRTAEEIAAKCSPPYEPSGGGFRNALGKLRTLELIEGRDTITANHELFG